MRVDHQRRTLLALTLVVLAGMGGCAAIAGYGDAVPSGPDGGTAFDARYDGKSDVLDCSKCAFGTCIDAACVCPSGSTACSTQCADTAGDPNNCGSCGHRCASLEYCNDGKCVCRPGFTLCGSGDEARCVDLSSDGSNCGTCSKSCSSICVGGTCGGSCSKSTCSSGKSCVDKSTDPRNCGDCGNSCDNDEVCSDGGCHGYAPAVGCSACPCPVCTTFASTVTCCPPLPGQKSPICVSGTKCP